MAAPGGTNKPTPDAETCDALTELDVRYVSVIWRNDEDAEPGRSSAPTLELGGCSDYEAAGMLRAALGKLEDANILSIEYGDDNEAEDA